METEMLRVQMLGGLAIRHGQWAVSDEDSRAYRVWLLLAYLLYHRKRPVTAQELIDLCWKDDTVDPSNALKTALHRVRTMLAPLTEKGGAPLLSRRGGSYLWNVPLSLDVEEFESLCHSGAAAREREQRIELYQKALRLYTGDFLPKLAAEPWVVPIAAYYHDLYVQTALETVVQLEDWGRLEDAAAVCRCAVEIEPDREELWLHLLQTLLCLGDHQGVADAYEALRDRLLSNFGVVPSERLCQLYRDAVGTVEEQVIPADALRMQLREKRDPGGSMLCDYDYFKTICYVAARTLPRSGSIAHICLFTVSAKNGGELPKKSMALAMENLRGMISTGLRRGDVAAQCSGSQYVVILPQANYENSCMVGGRIVRAFSRQYPHTPAAIRYAVWPVEPNE